MRFGAMGLKRPEAFPKHFRVYGVDTETSDSGRIRQGQRAAYTELNCILSVARPEEAERYRQSGVTVTHTIFHPGLPEAKENDVFALVKGNAETCFFRVKEVHNHGEMSVFTTYYCEERSDRD